MLVIRTELVVLARIFAHGRMFSQPVNIRMLQKVSQRWCKGLDIAWLGIFPVNYMARGSKTGEGAARRDLARHWDTGRRWQMCRFARDTNHDPGASQWQSSHPTRRS